MNTFSFFILLVLLFTMPITQTMESSSDLITQFEKNALDFAESACKKVVKTFFTVSNVELFKQEKPLIFDQFPTVFETTEKQAHSIASGATKTLSQRGFTSEDIKSAHLHFFKIKDALKAWETLKETYPSLANKIKLNHWKDEMPDPKYKIFMSINAVKKGSAKRTARL